MKSLDQLFTFPWSLVPNFHRGPTKFTSEVRPIRLCRLGHEAPERAPERALWTARRSS